MNYNLPELPLEEWESTKETLHRYFQIIGKIKMKLAPKQNHWWHIVLHTNSRGVTTRSIPYGDLSFEISFDFIDHELQVICSNGNKFSFPMNDGLTVASFYQQTIELLKSIGVKVTIKAEPYDLSDDLPFPDDNKHHYYDRKYVHRFWKVLDFTNHVFTEFAGKSFGKTSPVNIYWHHMDIAITRFNGKRGPEMPGASQADQEAYSHEVISCGFWAGDDKVREAAYYSYTYPSPKGIDEQPLLPKNAQWIDNNGSPMAFLPYSAIKNSATPKKDLLNFMNSAYKAGAQLANWELEERK